jgi:Raf kinase inhibitor-like YbhB/YbcL family protein
MLEKTPAVVGHVLEGVRPGLGKLVWADDAVEAPQSVVVESSAFAPDSPIPERYTADGEGLSPPIAWRDLPPAAAEVVLIVEDADSPTPRPLLHLLAWGLPAGPVSLAEGVFPSRGRDGLFVSVARNSFRKTQYLAPDPPPGHGPHRYVFQVFALDHPLSFDAHAQKHEVVQAMRGHVLARGRLVGLYERKG